MLSKTLISSAIGVGVIGGLSTGGYYLFKPEGKSLKEILDKENFVGLNINNSTDDGDWRSLVTRHLMPNLKIEKIKLELASGNDKDEENVAKLKRACQDLLSKKHFLKRIKKLQKTDVISNLDYLLKVIQFFN